MLRHKRNLAIICCAVLSNQAAYVTLESLQSTLNQSKGIIPLALLYACFMLSSILLPPWFITRLGCQRTIAMSMFSYVVYTAANFYPQPLTLIPAAVVVGVGAGIMWATVITYLVRLSTNQAKYRKCNADHVTEQSFSIFFAVVHSSLLVGSSVITILLFSISSDYEGKSAGQIESSTSSYNSSTLTTLNYSAMPENCQKIRNESCGLMHDYSGVCEQSSVTISTLGLYLLLGSFLALNLFGVILCLLLDEYPEDNITSDASNREQNSLVSEKANETSPEPLDSKQLELHLVQGTEDTMKANIDTKSEEGKDVEALKDNGADPVAQTKTSIVGKSPTALLKAVILLLADRNALLLIPHTMHFGMLQAFIRGIFNGSWIGCNLGLRYVSSIMIVYALVKMISSYGSGKLLQKVNHSTLFATAVAVELSVLIALLLWKPSTEPWPYFMLSSGLAVSHSLLKTQTPSAYVRFFPQQKKESAAFQVAAESIGISLMFAVSSFAYPFHVTIMVIFVTCCSYVLFVFASSTISQ